MGGDLGLNSSHVQQKLKLSIPTNIYSHREMAKISFFWVCEKLTLLVFLYENSQKIIFLMILYRLTINSNINYFLSYDLQILSQIDRKIWKSWILRKSGFCIKIVFLSLFELKKAILTPKKYLGVNMRGKWRSRKID